MAVYNFPSEPSVAPDVAPDVAAPKPRIVFPSKPIPEAPAPPPLDPSRVAPYKAGQEPVVAPERQWNFMGGALPNTEAADRGLTINPLSEAVLQNFDLTSDINSNRAAIEKIAIKTYSGLSKEVLSGYSDDQLKSIIGTPGLRKALALESATRERLAQSAEEAAILRGDIPLMFSAEGSIATYLRIMMSPEDRTAEALAARRRDVSFVDAVIEAPVKSSIQTFWGVVGEAQRRSAASRAKFAGKPGEAFVDAFENWSLNLGILGVAKPLAFPVEVVGKTGAGAAAAIAASVTDPEDAAALRAEAVRVFDISTKAIIKAGKDYKYPSDVQALIDGMPKGDGFFDQGETLAYLAANPVATAKWATITSAESFPGIAAGLVATSLGAPTVGLSLMTAHGALRELANINDPKLYKSILDITDGKIDLRTISGRAEFARNETDASVVANQEMKRFLGVRAATISVASLTGIKVAAALKPTRSMTLNVSRATGVNTLGESLGELYAGRLATGNYDFQEALLEGILGSGPLMTSLQLTVAGHADVLKRADDKRLKEWLRGNEELSGIVSGIPIEKLDTAASILADRMAAEGTPDVYISAENLLIFNQDGDAIDTLGLTQEEVRLAAAEGQDVQIGAETFIRHILGKDGFDSLIRHTTFEEGALTPDEAERAVEEGVRIEDFLKEEVDKLLGPELTKPVLDKLADDAAAIRSLVAEQIKATGRYDADKSDAFALLTASRYTARAVRIARETGEPVDAAALFEADNLRIQGGQPAAQSSALEQGRLRSVWDTIRGKDSSSSVVTLRHGGPALEGGKLDLAFTGRANDPTSTSPRETAGIYFSTEGGNQATQFARGGRSYEARLPAESLSGVVDFMSRVSDLSSEMQQTLADLAAEAGIEIGANESVGNLISRIRSELENGTERLVEAGISGHEKKSINEMVIWDQALLDSAELFDVTEGDPVQLRQDLLEQSAKEFGVSTEVLQAELAEAGGDITQTPRFKEWFGESKVVDAEGNPLVVYHGTQYDIKAFDPTASGSTERQEYLRQFGQAGMYFTDDSNYASAYTGSGREGTGPAIYPVYLSIQNPLVITDQTFWGSIKERIQNVGAGRRPPVYGAETSYIPQSRIEELKAQGYDGIINERAKEIIAFEPTQIKSTFNRGAFDPADPNILFQDAPDGALEQARATVQDPEALGLTADEAARINPIYRPEAMPTKRLGTNEKAAKWLEDQFDGDAIIDFTEVLSEEQINQLGRLTAAEAQLALESTGNAADWYSEAVLRAMDVASIKYPMLQDDAAAAEAGFGTSSNARFAFTYIMAVTSQNLSVSLNATAADTAFSEMVESIKSGDYSMKKEWGTGDKQAAMGKNFEKFLPMLNAMPGDTSAERMTALDAMFRASKTVREWEVEMKAAGIPYSPPGNTAKDAVVYGSSTLGPKIGNGFWQNLNGNFDPLTIDLWMRRTWGRLTGKSIGQPDAVPAQRRRLKAAISKSRSNEQGSPDLIEMARSDLASSEAALEAHKSAGQLEGQTKKDFSAETRRLNKEVSEGKALLSDLAGLKAPEPWKAEYGKTDDALLAYSNRLITAWSKEYKRLQETYGSANIPTELQPTWARAAKAIKSNLSTPLDQIANGTQRKQVEAVGQRAREILSERGIDVTTADLQALLWYPEKELWGGLRDELEVDADGIPVVTANSLNESYDTTFARIFRSQGYEVEGIEGDGAGGSGQGAVSGQDAGSVGPEGTAGTGQAGVQDNGRELFQEVDFAGDVIFEVAPDPNNVELSARWNALPPAAQLAISDTVSKSVLPSVLEAAEAEGSVSPQIGSYLEDTNPSFSLRLTSGDPAAVANAVGFVLSQDSMVALSADAFEGSFEAGAVRIQVGDKSLQEIDAIYQTLRGIEGFPQIGGQSTTDGQMTLILEEGVDPRGFADAVDNALASEYDVKAARLQAAFPEKKDYDYASDRNDPAGSAGVARQRYRDVRDQASQEVAAAIDQYERGGQQPALEQQRGAAGPRGGFTPSDLINDQDGNPVNLIQIFEKADPTTFLHESGHFWLEQLKADALAVGGGFQQDFKTVTDWWASRPLELREEAVRRAKKDKDKDSVAALQQMTEAQVSAYARSGELRGEGPSRYLSVAMHEQFARGAEDYFATARAPSLALGNIFSQLKVWIGSVYRRFTGLDVKFSPEVTGVVDRMLSSDEEITIVEGQYSMAPLLQTAEQAGMTPTQFAAYQKNIAEAGEARRAKQLSKTNQDHKRTLTKWWKDNKDALRPEVGQEVAALPVYRLMYAITELGLADGSVLPDGEAVARMDETALVEVLQAEGYSLSDMPKVAGKTLYMEGGEAPAIVAAAFGYEDVISMIAELVEVAPYADAVEAVVESKMEETHGAFDSMYEAVDSVHIDKTAQVLAAELQALRTTEPAFKQKFVRQYAVDSLLAAATKDIRPVKYIQAEKKHADLAGAALKRGDRTEAYKHQFHRLVNHYMATEALKAQRDVDKKSAYMKTFSKPGAKFPSIEAEYVDVIKTILKSVNFKGGAAGRAERTTEIAELQSFIETRQEQDGALLSVPDFLLDPETNPNNSIRGMSYLRFLQLHEVIKRYDTQGRNAKRALKGEDAVQLSLLKAELLTTLSARKETLVSRFRAKSASEENITGFKALSLMASIDGQLLKIEALLEAMDGSVLGPWHQALYEPFSAAAVQSQELQLEVSDLIGALVAALPKSVQKSFGKAVNPSLLGGLGKPGMRITRGNLVMLALNAGNESNLDKLIRGMGGDADTKVTGAGWNISEDILNTAFDQLTEAEWSLVKTVWAHAEKLWPAVDAIYRKTNGVSPGRVEPRTITTKFGDVTGGYFPLMYDKSVAGASADAEQKDALQLMQAEAGRASVNSSMTKARTGYAAPITMNIDKLASSFRNTIHFITHYEAVQNGNKILNQPDIKAAVEIKVGAAYYKELRAWLAALAVNSNDTTDLGAVGELFNQIYTNTTVAVLGASYTTLGMQTLGIINGQDRILADVGYTPKNAAMLQKDMAFGSLKALDGQHARWIMEVSGEMRFRRENIDQNVDEALRNLKGKTSVLPVIQRTAMQAIAQVQFYSVDMPVWTAAYNTSLRSNPNDISRAVKYADRVIRLSQSAGALKDLSPIQRKAYLKPFLMFYTWFAAWYATQRGMGVEFRDNITTRPTAAIARAATRMFVLLALTSVGVGLVRGKLPDWEEEDLKTGEREHAMLKFIARESLSTFTGSIPVLREMSSGWASGFGYSGGAGTIAWETIDKAISGVAKKVPELFVEDENAKVPDDERVWSDRAKKLAPYVMLLGVLKGIPAVQPNRTAGGLGNLLDEVEGASPMDLLLGPASEDKLRRRLED